MPIAAWRLRTRARRAATARAQRQGVLDQGVRARGRHFHRHQCTQRVQQDLREIAKRTCRHRTESGMERGSPASAAPQAASVNPRTLLGTALIPGTAKELRLYQSGDVFSIKILGRGDLMTSRMHGSEQALADLACEKIRGARNPRLLIGGLGMGFTLGCDTANDRPECRGSRGRARARSRGLESRPHRYTGRPSARGSALAASTSVMWPT